MTSNDTETKTCQHEPCDCQVPGSEEFCSSACREAQAAGRTDCPCPHKHCEGHPH